MKKVSCNNSIRKQAYKVEGICSAKNCTNKPISVLKLKYINKSGSFCKQHKDSLLQLELAEEFPRESK